MYESLNGNATGILFEQYRRVIPFSKILLSYLEREKKKILSSLVATRNYFIITGKRLVFSANLSKFISLPFVLLKNINLS